MFLRLTISLVLTGLIAAQVTSGQEVRKLPSKLVRISPKTDEIPKVSAELLRHGTSVVVHAIISKTGKVSKIEFVKGNSDLMPEARKRIKDWKYKPYIYQGQPVELDTTIEIRFCF
jgi:protein TonB